MTDHTTCNGCSGSFPESPQNIPEYLSSSSGCWAVYNHVLGQEFENKKYLQIHRLIPSAYQLQHTNQNHPQIKDKVIEHLITLQLIYKYSIEPNFVSPKLGKILRRETKNFKPLTTPNIDTTITILDLYHTEDVDQFMHRANLWAQRQWNSWQEHHPYIDTIILGYNKE